MQTCTVHLIRASLRFIPYTDRRSAAALLQQVYTAPTVAAAAEALDAFEGSNHGKKYPAAVRVWRDGWERFIPFLEFQPAVRKVIYTTNSIESLNYRGVVGEVAPVFDDLAELGAPRPRPSSP